MQLLKNICKEVCDLPEVYRPLHWRVSACPLVKLYTQLDTEFRTMGPSVSCNMDVTSGLEVSGWFSRKTWAKIKVKHYCWGLGVDVI